MSSTTFKSLVDTTFDSVEGYRNAAEKADSAQLKQALGQRLAAARTDARTVECRAPAAGR